MKINSSYILLKEIRCYAYHGVAPQENLIGNEYIIDLKLKEMCIRDRLTTVPQKVLQPGHWV